MIVGYALLVGWTLAEAGGGTTAAILLVGLPVVLYHLAFEVFFEGQTPGKLALKIRVARLDGAQPTLGSTCSDGCSASRTSRSRRAWARS